MPEEVISNEVECPYCGHVQSDHHNGGDPGTWWNTQYCPYGEMEVECDNCSKTFELVIDWEATFTSSKKEDNEQG